MTAQTTANRATTTFRIAPMNVVIVAILAFSAGLGLANITRPTITVGETSAQVGPTFDATAFRAEERSTWASALTFDPAKFRAEEHQP